MNYVDELGMTHLHVACVYSCRTALKRFLGRVDPNCCLERTGDSPLHLALDRNLGCEGTIRLRLRNGVDPNTAYLDGRKPLHVICARETGVENSADLANFSSNTVDVLLNRGADLASFVFPTENVVDFPYENELLNDTDGTELIPIRPDAIAAIVERLENGGYELDQSDSLVVMKLFAKHSLLLKTPDLQRYLFAKEEFLTKEKKIMIKPDLSFCDLVKLLAREATKRVTCLEYFKFSQEIDYLGKYRGSCELHMREMMPRKFFRRWALEPFMELTHYRLPILCCEMIIDNLMNEDLLHICLAAAGQSS
uniref:Uncharacterized protein n=1 Tax=Trichogramma kaykai TaxID=54128 RepID=A0ABD2WUP0_9HYME